MVGTHKNPPSNITKSQNIQRGRTNVGISSNKIFTIMCSKFRMLDSYVENITRARWGHMKIPKHLESMQELEQTSAHNLLKSKRKSGSAGRSLGGHYELAPLGPITITRYLTTVCCLCGVQPLSRTAGYLFGFP